MDQVVDPFVNSVGMPMLSYTALGCCLRNLCHRSSAGEDKKMAYCMDLQLLQSSLRSIFDPD